MTNIADPAATLSAAPDLAAFVAAAWTAHGDAPRAVADALGARIAQVAPGADGAGAINLAEHVFVSHLQAPAGLAGWLDRLAPGVVADEASGLAVRRARWVLAALDDAPEPPLPDAARWRAMQNLWSGRVARGRADDALATLRVELPRALAHPDAAARRALAAACNNLAVELRYGPRGDAARDALMLALAGASLGLWSSAGTWVHRERGFYLLAHCRAVVGDGAAALAHARNCLAEIDAHADAPEADAYERFFAHEALAYAQRAAGDAAGAAAERARMAELAAAVSDAGNAAFCRETLAAYDAVARA